MVEVWEMLTACDCRRLISGKMREGFRERMGCGIGVGKSFACDV
jgi:hypothetical protein